MSTLITRFALLRLAVAAALAAVSLGAAGAPTTAGASPTDAAQPASNTAHAALRTRTITLVTGEKLAVTTDRAGHVPTARPATGSPQTFLTRHFGDETYVVPVSAVPRLGRDLELSQFDISAMVAGRRAQKPGTVQPNYPMRTVRLKVKDPHGDPAEYASPGRAPGPARTSSSTPVTRGSPT